MEDKDIYQQLAEVFGFGNSRLLAEIIRKVADPNEARIMLAASSPVTVAELAEKSGIPEGEIGKALGPMYFNGLMQKSVKQDVTRYYRSRHIIQFHDAVISTPGISEELLDMWRKFDHNEWPKYHESLKKLLSVPASRVIPVGVAVTPESQIVAFEDVQQLVKNAHSLAVINCVCRKLKGDCGKPVEVCLQLDKSAEYVIERGTGREITREEAIDILRTAEEVGLVHTTSNNRSAGRVICNCCDDCCIHWLGSSINDKRWIAPSRFTAVVDSDRCTACEICVDRCHFNAISLGPQNDIIVINEENCMGCGLCLVTCDFDALSLKETKAEDFIPG